jgi:hypothetical protein
MVEQHLNQSNQEPIRYKLTNIIYSVRLAAEAIIAERLYLYSMIFIRTKRSINNGVVNGA